MSNYISEYLGIKSEIRDCCDCFGFYEDSEVIELPKKEAEDEYSSYRCKTCEAIKSGKILKKDAKHNDLNKRLKPFLFDIISKDLSIDKEILVKCSKCELIYSNDLGVINDSGIFTCHYCNDAFKTGEEKTHATNYYRDIWKEIDSVDWNVFEISIGVSENGKKDD